MIARLKGEVVDKDSQLLVIDVNGIGYEVNVSLQLAEETLLGKEVLIYIYDHIRENSRELFGFTDIESKKLFEKLIKVNGVGPKMAVAIMSLGDSKQIRSAIASENVAYISGATGVGKRIAERICVDLKDKVGMIAGQDVISVDDIDNDAVAALVALGYSQAQANMAVSKVDSKSSVEDQIKQALKEIS